MPRIVHFEINCDDPGRAADFYSKVFAWQINKWDGPQEYWLVKTGESDEPGIDGGLMKRGDPGASLYNIVQVDSVDTYVARITEAGGSIVVPKMPIPGVGWFAYFKDTENNVLGIMEPDQNAGS